MMMISICLAGQNDNLSKETSEKNKFSMATSY